MSTAGSLPGAPASMTAAMSKLARSPASAEVADQVGSAALLRERQPVPVEVVVGSRVGEGVVDQAIPRDSLDRHPRPHELAQAQVGAGSDALDTGDQCEDGLVVEPDVL